MIAASVYQVIIGLEVHVQLKTESKIFCGCSTEYTLEPNIQVCPVCAGFPGVLPGFNEKVKRLALRTALALSCEIAFFSQFSRKQYFYPDIPKNYQISQYDLPLAKNGFLKIKAEGKIKKIGITRVHLEEDAGKLLHAIGSEALEYSLVDLNRSGVPLLEIVSEPDLNSPEEAFFYLQELKPLLRYIEVSDCNMEEGSLRCDANISLRKRGAKKLGVKAELKNMNSFRAVKKALDYEAKRQEEILSQGGEIIQETRLWDEKEELTRPMRRKEEAHDYRYFPEPDLLPLLIDEEEIEEVKRSLPESPAQRRERFQIQYSLSDYDISVLTAEKDLADFYEAVVKEYVKEKKLSPQISLKSQRRDRPVEQYYKKIANWVMGEFKAALKTVKNSIQEAPVTPVDLARLIIKVEDNKIPVGTAKKELKKAMGIKFGEISLPASATVISEENAIKKVIQEVIQENKEVVEKFHQGKEKALGFLIGQVMKKTQGRAEPKLVNKILREELLDTGRQG
ncbi:MAG: Asp-tRNA(Asn)/Glu-tRNA(Gln) amidotransferase subunit GatB [Candidatus Ratteibacteria bacterium]|nr:Asp-tRNA(Asn)/Glu-tRNA(Gln) amidotransferase subunit GatB [Candidatus Ratteibacteria bacterium]